MTNIRLNDELAEREVNDLKKQRHELTFSASNLYTFCNKGLKGQTPSQSGFAQIQLSDVPTYNIGVNIQF